MSTDSPATYSLSELKRRVATEYQTRTGRVPSVIAAAPGRVNLIGEHVDYNDGFVLPMAIQRYVVVAAGVDPRVDSRADSSQATFHSLSLSQDATIRLDRGNPISDCDSSGASWGRYLEGVLVGFSRIGVSIPPLTAVIDSSVPAGGGLSSSAALEVAVATMLEGLTGETIGGVEKALLCQRAEHDFAGVPCGIMDQFSSVFGKLNELMLIDCVGQTIQPVRFGDTGVSVLIINSNVAHELAAGQYARRRALCDVTLEKLGGGAWRNVTLRDLTDSRRHLTDRQHACGHHVVTEIKRTLDAATALKQQDWVQVGRLMYASHQSLRDDFQVSCHELDVLVQAASEIGIEGGIYGSRMTGGGFGGCTVTLVRSDQTQSVQDRMLKRYRDQMGIEATAFVTRPALGAHLSVGGQTE